MVVDVGGKGGGRVGNWWHKIYISFGAIRERHDVWKAHALNSKYACVHQKSFDNICVRRRRAGSIKDKGCVDLDLMGLKGGEGEGGKQLYPFVLYNVSAIAKTFHV